MGMTRGPAFEAVRPGVSGSYDRTGIARRRMTTGIDIVKEELIRPVHRL
jgi:hypothetical protein